MVDILERLRQRDEYEVMLDHLNQPYGLEKSLEHEAADEIGRLRLACTKMNDEVCQRLGKALGYPWFKDDQQNFPDATEENGVCTGEHVAESIASEAASWILKVEAELNDLKKYVKLLEENSQNLSDEVENLRSDLREIYKAGQSDEKATARRMSQMAGAAFARSHING